MSINYLRSFLFGVVVGVFGITTLNADITLRARVISIEPEKTYVRLLYSMGQLWEELTREKPRPPTIEETRVDFGRDQTPVEPDMDLGLEVERAEPDVIREEGSTYTTLWIKPGIWSPDAPVSVFPLFTTFMVVPRQQTGKHVRVQPGVLESVTVEFQIREGDKVLKTFSEKAGSSGRLTIRIASGRLDPNGKGITGLSAFLDDTMGLHEYVRRRAEHLASLPWAEGPRPRRYGFLTACSGWDRNASDPAIWEAEYRALRLMGVNGLMYDTWPGFEEAVRSGPEWMQAFRRLRGFNMNQILHWEGGGYLIPDFDPRNPTRSFSEGWGCPSHPAHRDLPQKIEKAVAEMVERLRATPFEEYWGPTVDEIGSYFDRSAERKAHQGVCPYCIEAFRNYLRGFGLAPADFGVDSWEPIRSTFGYFDTPWSSSKSTDSGLPKEPADPDRLVPRDIADDALFEGEKKEKEANGESSPTDRKKHPFSEGGWALLTYYSRRFNNEASARIFTPLRDALNAQNERKRKALAEERFDSPEAKQPWLYAGALRGNTFLMGGHSLDFFDWYRHADNGFMYETSNRDPRVWPWDSYLCDVGRIHQEKLGTRFCMMIKPGRGAVVQRALAAIGRGVRMIYWYTYGPDWHHPDTFARDIERLEKISRLARMLGETEERLHEASWAIPAQVAVVRPFTSSVFENNASWENGKWIYSMLQHLHVPVDALDEGYLLTEDLTRYRVIVVSGSHLRRDCADKLKEWVRAGGILIGTGCGLARDESDQPLSTLQEVLGLEQRTPPVLWSEVRRYGATALADFIPLVKRPVDACVMVPGEGEPAAFDLFVGRENWTPSSNAEILARYGDGGAAVVRNTYGKGSAVSFGFYAGLEYAADILRPDYDMSAHFNPLKRRILESVLQQAGIVRPLEISHPLVEGLRLRHPRTGEETIVLMNWSYRGRDGVPLNNVELRWHGERSVSRAKSTWFQEWRQAERAGDEYRIVLPRLEDGDILIVE